MTPPFLVVLGLALAILCAAHPSAAAPSAEERAVAADLFESAVAYEEEGNWVACEAALDDAVAIIETPGLRFHLAYCKEQQKRWVEALVDYRRAQEMMRQGTEANDVAALLPEALSRLESALPRLTLALAPVPSDTTLHIDGKAASAQLFGKPLPLDPGNRRIEVAAPGYEPFHSELSLLPSERRTLEIVLVAIGEKPAAAPEPAPAAVAPSAEASEPWITPKGWVMLSEAVVAGAALGVGIGFSVEADARERDRRTLVGVIDDPSACSGGSPDERCALLQRAIQETDDAQSFATAGYVTSAVGLAAFLGTWLLWPSSDSAENASPDDASDTAIAVTGSADGSAVTFTHRF